MTRVQEIAWTVALVGLALMVATLAGVLLHRAYRSRPARIRRAKRAAAREARMRRQPWRAPRDGGYTGRGPDQGGRR